MYDCPKCGFRLTGTAKKCPFCQGELTGEPDGENVFPKIPWKKRKHGMFMRLLAMGTVAAAAVCFAVNYSLQEYGWWSAFVIAGLLSAWVVVGIAVKKHGNPLKAVLCQVCAGTLLVLAWDCRTGFGGWSVDFVLPVLYSSSFFMMLAIVLFMRLKTQDYLLCLVWDLMLGLIPLILLLGDMLRVTVPSVICVLVSAVGFTGLVLFKGPALKAELIRNFHL